MLVVGRRANRIGRVVAGERGRAEVHVGGEVQGAGAQGGEWKGGAEDRIERQEAARSCRVQVETASFEL